MTKAQIEQLVANWLEAALDEAEDGRAMGGPISDDAREAIHLGMSYGFSDTQEELISGDYRRIANEADEVLQAAGLPALDHASPDFAKLCRRLLRAKLDFFRIESDRWDGKYQDLVPSTRQSANATPPPPPTLPFSKVLEKFLLAHPRPARTGDPLKAEFRRFTAVVGGDKPMGTISRADGVRYKEYLQQKRKLHPATCLKHLSSLDMVFKWAEVHEYIPKNPMKGLAPTTRQAKKDAQDRRPFTTEELVQFFGSPIFMKQKTIAPQRYWLPLLLLFQVCRREEAGQLYLKDLVTKDGVLCQRITDTEPDQNVKNDVSRRTIPLHPDLIRLGFLEYMEDIEKRGHKRLFPQLKKKGVNGYSDPVGKWFGRTMTRLGLTDPSLVMHSLRHGGLTNLHGAGVPDNIVERLAGHSKGTEHEKYVHRDLLPIKALKEGLEKLTYPEVMQVLLTR